MIAVIHYDYGKVFVRHVLTRSDYDESNAASGAGIIAESTVSEVLAGKRTLNRGQIAKLSRYFQVSAGVFLAER